MLFQSLSTISSYPNERLLISYNAVNPPLINSRIGIRFRYFYYGDDNKLNLTNSEYPVATASIPPTTLARNYVLSSYSSNGILLSAKTPTEFLTVNSFTPFRWTVNNPSEFLQYTIRGGLSSLTVFPSHPFPKITKISNNVINVSCGLVAASGFNGNISSYQFKNFVKDSNYATLSNVSVITTTPSFHKAKTSDGVKDYVVGNNVNNLNYYYTPYLNRNIYDSSFRIDVPVVTSTKDTDPVYYLSFVCSNFSNKNNDTITNGYVTLSCLRSEILEKAGMSFPYTFDFPYNRIHPALGEVYIHFRQLLVKKGYDITATYKTSASFIGTDKVVFQNIASNSVNISCNNALTPLYMQDYTLYSPDTISDALTISFEPSSRMVQLASSAFRVDTIVTDNYYQNIYSHDNDSPLLKRFVEIVGDGGLLSKDENNIWRRSTEWMPFSSTMILFNTDNKANKYQFRIEAGSNGRVLKNNYLNFFDLTLNKEKAVLSPMITENGSSSATIYTVSLPFSYASFPSKWDVYPPENIVLTKIDGTVINRNEFYPDLFNIKIYNLGVDKTKITFYSSEFETSASTYWFPPSSISQECTMQIKGDVFDENENGTISISALWNRNGYSYRIPTDANIIWNETANDPRGRLTFRTSSETPYILTENSVYAGKNDYGILNCSVSTEKVASNPRSVVFDVNCNVFNSTYNFNTNNIFLYNQFPSNDFLNILALTATGSELFSSSIRKHYILKNSSNIYLSADIPSLIVDDDNIFWTITKSDGSNPLEFSGLYSSFSFDTLSAKVQISTFNSKPFSGNFGYYNLTDYMVFYNLSSIQPLDYISFPENKYNPLEKIASNVENYNICGKDWNDVSFNLYTNSNGMTSYKSCHTENFYFSANSGFDNYVWKIGNKLIETKNNKIIIPLSYQDVSSNNNVYLSAYNNIFLKSDPVTIYNSSYSDNTSIYKQPIQFLDFPSPVATIKIDNNICDCSKYGQLPKLSCVLDTNNIDIDGYTFDIILSSQDFIQTKTYSDNSINFSKILKIGIENSDYIIKENSFNDLKIYLSGNIGVTIKDFDFCTENKTITSNIINLSVYNGPNLDLYCENNYASSGQIVTFINNSNTNFLTNSNIKYTNFIFDNGEGTIISTSNSSISTLYISQGAKTPSLTGFLSNSAINIQSWKDMVYIKDEYELYNKNISREFTESINLPFSLEDCKIKSNDWQFASNINDCFNKLKTNLDFLSSCCYINNLNFPKSFGGILASKYGNFKWHTKIDFKNIQDEYFYDIKSGQIINDEYLLITNGDLIQLYSISQPPQLIYSINRIGDGEVLENPSKCIYANNKLYILDTDKNLMLVCDFDINDKNSIKLTHYWGGTGGREEKSKLNNPTDFCIDDDYNLYIVDKDSYIIKVYNKNLNWIRNIDSASFSEKNKPVNISCDGTNLSCVTENGECLLFDIYGNITEILNIKNTTKAFLNKNHYGIIYLIDKNIIKKYTINNTLINEQILEHPIIDVIYDKNHCYILTKNYVYKITDFIEIDSILTKNESISGFSWNNIFIKEHEFVTDYIYNDSFKKIKDNISILNKRINKKLMLQYNDGKVISNQYTVSYTASSLSDNNILIGINEPVLYDTINRSIENLYNNILELKDNISLGLDYPNINNNIRWIWKYHYIDTIQKPSILKSPVSWAELNSYQIGYNTVLSSASSWCSIRYNLGNNNHSDICFNFSQTRKGSYIPFTWADMEQSSDKCNFIKPYKWEELEEICCIKPDFVFEDCKIIC